MVPRKRAKSRMGWPDNLYPNKDGYKYRHPITRKEKWMGKDFAKAKAAAITLNSLLAKSSDLVAHVMGSAKTVKDAVEVFRTDDVPDRGWGEKTATWYEVFIKRIETDLGDRSLESLEVKDCAEYVRGVTESARSRQTYRLVLGWVLACAVQEGWIDSNPALQTRKFSHTRKRERLTLDAFKAIRGKAPAWLQIAMDLSLLTLLRREDVSEAKLTDIHSGKLHIIPAKTEGSTQVKLRIEMTEPLKELVARARDSVLSPYIVHRMQEKARPSDMRAKGRKHHTQVLPEQISRAFKDAREAAGIGGDNPPTFHEIRSLGGALLAEAGWTTAQIQALMGHASESMTEHYLGGHETPWIDVAPGISLPR